MSFVSLKNVYKRYQMGEVTITASDGVSFDIEKGEFVVITGASGAGKTTVLNLMGGMDTCDEGEIIIDGKDIATTSPHSFPAANSREFPLQERWQNHPSSCSAMSLRALSTITRARQY